MADLRRTPLYAVHRQSGAKMVPFGDWEMPVEYAGLISEHLAVRNAAGLFDVSHMGQIHFSGPDATVDVGMLTIGNPLTPIVGRIGCDSGIVGVTPRMTG